MLHLIHFENLLIAGDSNTPYGYRNKMEYALTEQSDGSATLASFERSTHRIRAITPCVLAYPAINEAAQKVLAWLDLEKLPARIFECIFKTCPNTTFLIVSRYHQADFEVFTHISG